MSAETIFKCDVCRIDIKSDGFAKEQAFAFRWVNNEVLTTKGTSPYRDAPIHLCVTCVKAIANWEKEPR